MTIAGGGLGKSYALELAKRGCNVVVNDLGGSMSGSVSVSAVSTGSKLQISDGVAQVVQEIKDFGGNAVGDGNNVLDAKLIVENAVHTFGGVDIIVNNAGILRDKSFHKMTEKDWQSVIDVHLLGTFRMCHEAWPLMQKQNYGRIVNVSSGAATYGNFGQANYAAAKLGILGLSNVLAKEGGKNNIFVNTLVPVAASRMTENLLSEELLDQMDPKHVTPIVAYLAHESNAHSGRVYEVGGGWYSSMRWERSEGVLLGGKIGDSDEDKVATVEDIANNIEAICDFGGDNAYPTSPTDAITTFTSMLVNGGPAPRDVPDAGATPSGGSDTTDVAESGEPMTPVDKLQSTALFTAVHNALLEDPVV